MSKVITERKPVQTTAAREEFHVGEAKNSGSGKSASVGPGGINHHEVHMGHKNGTPPAAPAFDDEREIAQLKDRIQQLTSCVLETDSMTADSLAQIISAARLALAYMETPDAYDNTELLADAFHLIWQTAETCDNCNRSYVEQVDIEPHADVRGNARLLARMKNAQLPPL